MNKPPAFQLYADDFLSGTMIFSQSEIGAYIRLLCHQWNSGSIPNDATRLKKLAGGHVSDHVLAKFEIGADGLLRNKRMELERQKQQAFRDIQSDKGRKGASTRWHGTGNAPAIAQASSGQWPEHSSPSPSPVSISKERESTHAPESEIPSWLEFWEYCQSLQCGLPAEWYAKDKFEAANESNWKNRENWRAYARRCRSWWETDGRPMKPPNKKEDASNKTNHSQRNAGTYNADASTDDIKSKVR